MSKAKSIGSTAALLLFVVAFGKLIFSAKPVSVESRNRVEQRAFRRGLMEKKRAELFIDSLLKAQGAVFLYTNDTLARAGWVPDMESSGVNGVTSMVVEISNYKEFAAKYDSMGFTLLLNGNGKFFYPLNNVFIPAGGETAKHLYFTGYDSKGKMLNDSASLKAYPRMKEENFVTAWGMGVNDMSKLTIDSLADPHFLVCLDFLKSVRGFFIYMAGVEKDGRHSGMDSAGFKQAVSVFNKRLRKAG